MSFLSPSQLFRDRFPYGSLLGDCRGEILCQPAILYPQCHKSDRARGLARRRNQQNRNGGGCTIVDGCAEASTVIGGNIFIAYCAGLRNIRACRTPLFLVPDIDYVTSEVTKNRPSRSDDNRIMPVLYLNQITFDSARLREPTPGGKREQKPPPAGQINLCDGSREGIAASRF
jgi:hypothetical protein